MSIEAVTSSLSIGRAGRTSAVDLSSVKEKIQRRLGELATYNQEDLGATWAVLEWLRRSVSE